MAYWWLAFPARANPRSPQRLLSEVLPSFRMTGHMSRRRIRVFLRTDFHFPSSFYPTPTDSFPELRALTLKSTLNGEIAYELDPTHSSAFDVKMSTHPRHIFFLERVSSGGCRMIPCRAEYVREFFEQNAERLPDELPEAKAVRSSVIQLLSACPSWILRTGESPQTTAAALDVFLLEVNRATA